MGQDPARELTETITEALAGIRAMVLDPQVATEAVRRLAEVAQLLIPLAVGTGVTVVEERGECTTIAATGPAVAEVDAWQCELGEGPCLRAWDTATVQYLPDTATAPRWPEWSRAAAAAGIRSALAAPVIFGQRELGAMTVYAGEPHAFTDHEERLLGLLAEGAAPLVMAAGAGPAMRRLSASLVAAVEAFGRVERAVGVLMGRHHLAVRPARTRLLAAACRTGQSLAQVADTVLHGHGSPP
jgi:transcriptional regulator with GAF, ATPase, and Fis domain